MSEQDERQPDRGASPAAIVQAGLATAAASVGDEPVEVPDLNGHPDGTEESDEG